jgi:hypothetical protein
VKPVGTPLAFASVENEYCVFAMQTGRFPKPCQMRKGSKIIPGYLFFIERYFLLCFFAQFDAISAVDFSRDGLYFVLYRGVQVVKVAEALVV